MKPFFIACLILLSLFTAGVMNARTVSQLSDSIETQLSYSQASAQRGQWGEVGHTLHAASETWQEHKTYLHVTLDHGEIEETEALFAEARQYAAREDADRYCLCAERLAVQLEHLKESQKISVQNVL